MILYNKGLAHKLVVYKVVVHAAVFYSTYIRQLDDVVDAVGGVQHSIGSVSVSISMYDVYLSSISNVRTHCL